MRRFFFSGSACIWIVVVFLVGSTASPRAADSTPRAQAQSSGWRLVSHASVVIARPEGQTAWQGIGYGETLADTALVATGISNQTTFVGPRGTLEVGPESRLSVDSDRVQLLAGVARVSAAKDQSVTVVAGDRTVDVASEKSVRIAWSPHAAVPEVTELNRDTQAAPGQRRPEGLGQLVIGDAQAESAVRLQVARYHVNVVLQPPMALVQIDQSFFNPFSAQQQGTFAFSLPPGASVSRFAMYVTPNQLIEGEVIERKRARQVYDSIVNRRRDPAILEEIGPNQFRMQVFPIFAQDTKRVLLDFTVPLNAIQGTNRFRLPLLSDREPIWDFQLKGVVRGAAPATIHSPTHDPLPLENDERTGESRFQIERQMFKPDSDFALTFRSNDAEPALRRYLARPFPAAAQRENASGRVPFPVPSQLFTFSYFQATFPAPKAPDAPPSPVDLLIMVDTSTIVKQRAQLRAWARTLARTAPESSRVRVACADAVFRPMTTDWCAPGSQELDDGLSRLSKEFFLGIQHPETTLNAAVAAFQQPPGNKGDENKSDDNPDNKTDAKEKPKQRVARNVRRRLVLYVGPGFESANLRAWGEAPADAQANQDARQAPVDPAAGFAQSLTERFDKSHVTFAAVLIDDNRRAHDPTRRFAEQTGGYAFDGALPEDQTRALTWLANGVAPPVRVTSVTAVDSDPGDLFASTVILPGEPLRVLGRISRDITQDAPEFPDESIVPRKENADDKQEGRQDDKKPTAASRPGIVSVQFDGEPGPREMSLYGPRKLDDIFVGRLWAQTRLEQLKSREAVLKVDAKGGGSASSTGTGQDPARLAEGLRDQMIELSQEWSVLSPHTAFLVLESEADYERFGMPRRPRRQYWSPAGKQLNEPLPADWLARVRPDETTRKKLESAPTKQMLAHARRALAAEQFETARGWLDAAAGSPELVRSEEYQQLDVQIRRGLARQQVIERLGGRLPALAPERAATQSLDNSPDLLLLGLRGSPLPLRVYDRLSRNVEPPSGELTLEALAEWTERLTGTPVDLDKRNLEAMAIGADTPIRTVSSGAFTLENYLRLTLDQFELAIVEDHERLLITSIEESQNRQQRVEYPVADLIHGSEGPSRDRLWLRAGEQWRLDQHQRLLTKLERPLTFEFRNQPLVSVLKQVAALGDLSLFVDVRGLDQEGFGLDGNPVTVRARDLPAGKALERVLSGMLSFWTRGEAVVITSQDRVERFPYPRVHSVRGVLTESRVGSPWPWSPMLRGSEGLGGGIGAFGGSFGGGFGGMGGMGGGMFGGGGGGVGGGGGGGGGFGGGGFAGPSTVAGASSDPFMAEGTPRIGLGGDPEPASPASLGGDATASSNTAETDSTPPGPPSASSPTNGSTPSDSPPSTPEDQFVQDWIELQELIVESVVTKSGWTDDGGIGRVVECPATLDLVVNGTDRIHAEVALLLDRLRRSRLDATFSRNARLARTPRGMRGQPVVEFDEVELMRLLQETTCRPNPGWLDEGGPTRCEFDFARALLVINADSRSHDEIHTLLTQLHRSRYEQLNGSRPWENPRALLAPPPDDAPHAPVDPAQHVAELELLKVRTDQSSSGAWTNRRDSDGLTLKMELKRAGERVEVRFPSMTLRIDGSDGAIASHGMRWVEVGPWGESMRRVLDALLPWMPHRSNEQLARQFDITRERADKSTVTLRFTPTRSPEPDGAALSITFDRQTGQAVAMSALVAGELFGRMAPIAGESAVPAPNAKSKAAANKAKKAQRKIKSPPVAPSLAWTNAQGRRVVEWTRDVPPATPDVPAIDAQWNNFTLLDLRPYGGRSPRLVQAWKAIREQNDASAYLMLTDEIRERGPAVATCFLRAWCAQRDSALRGRADVMKDLRFVFENAPNAWTDRIHPSEFPQLSNSQYYELLSLTPESRRSAADEERLAYAAVQLSEQFGVELKVPAARTDDPFGPVEMTVRPNAQAVRHLKASFQKSRLQDVSWPTIALAVKLAVENGDIASARKWAVDRVKLAQDAPRDIGELAADLDLRGQREIAETIVEATLRHKDVRGWDRDGLARQLAQWRRGMPRWRLLVEAQNSQHEALGKDGATFHSYPSDIDVELVASASLDEVTQLAELAKYPLFKTHLLWLRGDISQDTAAVYQWTREAIDSPDWPAVRLAQRCERLNRLGAPDRVVALLEELLRRDQNLSDGVQRELGKAYLTLNRDGDAVRTQ